MIFFRDKGKGETGGLSSYATESQSTVCRKVEGHHDLFQERLHTIVVDEAHCITK